MNTPNLNDILDEIFFNGTEEAIEKLKKYDLYQITQKKIEFFNDSIDNNKAENLSAVYASFVQSINTKLENIEDLEVKEHLKHVLSSIGNYLIDELIKSEIITFKDIKDLKESLFRIYNLLGYDFKDLEKRTQFNRITSLLENQQIKRTLDESKIHYEWLGDPNHFDEISRNLKSENTISSIKDFKKLFSSEPIPVNFNKDKFEFVTVLFDTMYEKKIIRPKIKKGHFAPLKNYAVDFENNILFKKEMKQIKYTIKKNEKKYTELRDKAEKWIVA